MSSFALYLVGFVIFTIGLAIGAYLIGVPPMWIGVGVVVLIGLGMLSGVGKTRQKDDAEEA